MTREHRQEPEQFRAIPRIYRIPQEPSGNIRLILAGIVVLAIFIIEVLT